MDWKHLLTSFNGRINRGKFWAAIGVVFVVSIAAQLIDAMTGIVVIPLAEGAGFGPLTVLTLLASVWVGLAVYAKRWHDRGKSGWWSLIMLVPIIGGIWLIVECGILEGDKGPNAYGPDPLGR
ncbi:MAG: DUF805 domain-containing protein [Rhizobiaceae bacterium]